MKANTMLDILERECGEAKEQLLADICDLCHRPYELNQEELEERCAECTIPRDLEALLEKQRTVTAGRVMQITAEEMIAGKEGTR